MPVGVAAPELRVVNNSALPFSLNDGPLWAGRGTNALVTAGLGLRFGAIRLILAPQFTTSENRAFQVIPYPQNDPAQRSVWANPFHPPASSIDLPFRFGDASLRRFDPGQSSLTADLPRVSDRVATENLWWGPGARNAIVLSNNAAGFPHVFVQTRDGVRTRIGRFDAQWILGGSTNPVSSIPSEQTTFARSADSLSSGRRVQTADSASALHDWCSRLPGIAVFRPAPRSTFCGMSATRTQIRRTVRKAGDRIEPFPFFGRWVFPQAGFETYAELGTVRAAALVS